MGIWIKLLENLFSETGWHYIAVCYNEEGTLGIYFDGKQIACIG